jgi:hypothetical protein
VTLVSEDTCERVVRNLKGKLKMLVTERDAKVVFSSLLVLKRILEFDKTQKIIDFELIQSLIMNLGHIENNIFDETMEILTYLRILDDDTYIRVMFTMDGIIRLLDIFPHLKDMAKINFCLSVFYQFTHDPKTAGSVMAKGGKVFYETLYNNLHKGNADAKYLILKILNKILMYSNTTDLVEKFPDWNCLLEYLNLSYS